MPKQAIITSSKRFIAIVKAEHKIGKLSEQIEGCTKCQVAGMCQPLLGVKYLEEAHQTIDSLLK